MDHPITDPTDFAKTKIPDLEQWDTLLRCHICKDFLKVPVLTPCGHTFCSLCIRKYINNSAKFQFLHCREKTADQTNRRKQINLHHLIDLIIFDPFKRMNQIAAGIIDQYMEAFPLMPLYISVRGFWIG